MKHSTIYFPAASQHKSFPPNSVPHRHLCSEFNAHKQTDIQSIYPPTQTREIPKKYTKSFPKNKRDGVRILFFSRPFQSLREWEGVGGGLPLQ